ncbi:MAG TPA: hypothetical protein VKB86_19130 [Pyrinomonadaceae bacterium]|nr:hypothetical protein [Pyrinomonadaceae bacterium]
MKPLKSEIQNSEALQEIGRASVQIVHDLKNQLNGLKLYATFLRKRMEKSERPEDERETIMKLIAGLERAAADMTALVRFSRPLELKRKSHTDLAKILEGIQKSESVPVEIEANALVGEFDVAAITEALRDITLSASELRSTESLRIHSRADLEANEALIEWRGLKLSDGDDPFHSFAGSGPIRMSLAAKIIEAHGGRVEHAQDALRIHLPLTQKVISNHQSAFS